MNLSPTRISAIRNIFLRTRCTPKRALQLIKRSPSRGSHRPRSPSPPHKLERQTAIVHSTHEHPFQLRASLAPPRGLLTQSIVVPALFEIAFRQLVKLRPRIRAALVEVDVSLDVEDKVLECWKV